MAYNPNLYNPYMNQMNQYQPQFQPQYNPQMIPTIHADIVQVENEAAASAYPVGAGASQMMIARDDSAIFVKTASANGQYTLAVFEKRPTPTQKPFDPAEYIRKDELETLLKPIMEAHSDEHI